jgi:hypothetical protein
MPHDLHAPPVTPVVNLAEGRPLANRDVWNACRLIWASVVIAFVQDVFAIAREPSGAAIVGAVIGALIGGALVVFILLWITAKLKARRNWMRLLVTYGAIAGYLSVPILWQFYGHSVFSYYANNTVALIVDSSRTVLSLCAIVFLNTRSSRAWFKSARSGMSSVA